MDDSPGHMLISQPRIAARVRALGLALTRHYRGRRPVFLGIMNGALFFLTDLVRVVELQPEISCIRLASYAGRASTGQVRGLGALSGFVRGREVLIVDDILDTGTTLHALREKLRRLGAADIRICVLLQKRRAREAAVRADWVGFRIRDAFVVGYGLDLDGHYRGLAEIRILPKTTAKSAGL